MYLGDLFRSFLPLRNPIGFGVADFVVFAIALLLSVSLLAYALLLPLWNRIAHKTGLVMASLAALAVCLRLALLPASAVPIPAGADDFGYILLADTLAHGRLANSTHPLHEFFETVFVLQQPTYSSIYPLAQGLLLAGSRIFSGSFWVGVLASTAILIALIYWMLRGWLPPRWALAGGLLALMPFGPLSQWTNSYWGGAISACAGCLVFGSLPRLSHPLAHRKRLYAALLGTGLALQLLARPFEFILLAVAVLLYWLFVAKRRRLIARLVTPVLIPLSLAAILTLAQNKSVTGSWTALPYMLSRYQYGVPATFTFQPNPVPHRQLTPEQDLDYRAQAAIHGDGHDSLTRFAARLWFRLRYLRFFAPAPLYLAALFFLPQLREPRFLWAAAVVLLFLAGTNFYPYFFPHYIAAAACVLLLIALAGLQTLARSRASAGRDPAPPGKSGTSADLGAGRESVVLRSSSRVLRFANGPLAVSFLLSLCAAHFLFWYALHASHQSALLAATPYEPASFINFGDPEGRRAVADQLAHPSDRQLVFVRYAPQHRFSEWVANSASIDSAPVVWARDLGVTQNERLLHYYPDRKAWLLEPDTNPPRLTDYASHASSFEPVR